MWKVLPDYCVHLKDKKEQIMVSHAKETTRQWPGTDIIEFHILPQTPNGKGARTTKTALKLKQHKWKVKGTRPSEGNDSIKHAVRSDVVSIRCDNTRANCDGSAYATGDFSHDMTRMLPFDEIKMDWLTWEDLDRHSNQNVLMLRAIFICCVFILFKWVLMHLNILSIQRLS